MKLWHEVFQNFSLTTLLPGAVRLRGLRTWRDGVRVVLRGQVARRDRPQRVAERDGAGEPPAAVHARGDGLRPLRQVLHRQRGHSPPRPHPGAAASTSRRASWER